MSHGIHNKKKIAQLADELSKSTHFTKYEIEAQLQHFQILTKKEAKMNKALFQDVLHKSFGFTDDLSMDRVLKVFDRDSDNFISMEEWIKGLSILLRGTFAEKTKYCFEVYDLNNDGYITRDEMFRMMQKCLAHKNPSDEDPDEGVKDLIDILLKMLDHDHDNRISLEDFVKSVTEKKLLLESMGPCIPDKEYIDAYMADMNPHEDGR